MSMTALSNCGLPDPVRFHHAVPLQSLKSGIYAYRRVPRCDRLFDIPPCLGTSRFLVHSREPVAERLVSTYVP
jgi:hypothetical protein